MHFLACPLPVHQIPEILVQGHTDTVLGVAFHPKRPHKFATVCDSYNVYLWNAKRRQLIVRPAESAWVAVAGEGGAGGGGVIGREWTVRWMCLIGFLFWQKGQGRTSWWGMDCAWMCKSGEVQAASIAVRKAGAKLLAGLGTARRQHWGTRQSASQSSGVHCPDSCCAQGCTISSVPLLLPPPLPPLLPLQAKVGIGVAARSVIFSPNGAHLAIGTLPGGVKVSISLL